MKKEVQVALITGIFGLVGTVTSAIIGVATGKTIERKNILNEVQSTVTTITGDNNQVVFNDISEFASNYVDLNKEYEKLQDDYIILGNLYSQTMSELNEEKDKLDSLQQAFDNLSNNYNTDILSKPNVEYSNINLIINGIESGYVDRVVTINNETFYSIGFLKYLVDNQAVSSDTSKLFIGNVQSEDKMPVSLFDEDTYLECGYLSHGYSISGNIETTDSFIDNNGNEYFDGIYRWIPNFDIGNTYIECLVDDYSIFTGTIILNYDCKATPETARLLIYGDDKLIYASPEMTRGISPVDFSINIENISVLRIEFTKEYELIALVNPYLYP